MDGWTLPAKFLIACDGGWGRGGNMKEMSMSEIEYILTSLNTNMGNER